MVGFLHDDGPFATSPSHHLNSNTGDPPGGDSLSTLVTGALPCILATIETSNGPAELTRNAAAYA
jgi:hypothetical protein